MIMRGGSDVTRALTGRFRPPEGPHPTASDVEGTWDSLDHAFDGAEPRAAASPTRTLARGDGPERREVPE